MVALGCAFLKYSLLLSFWFYPWFLWNEAFEIVRWFYFVLFQQPKVFWSLWMLEFLFPNALCLSEPYSSPLKLLWRPNFFQEHFLDFFGLWFLFNLESLKWATWFLLLDLSVDWKRMADWLIDDQWVVRPIQQNARYLLLNFDDAFQAILWHLVSLLVSENRLALEVVVSPEDTDLLSWSVFLVHFLFVSIGTLKAFVALQFIGPLWLLGRLSSLVQKFLPEIDVLADGVVLNIVIQFLDLALLPFLRWLLFSGPSKLTWVVLLVVSSVDKVVLLVVCLTPQQKFRTAGGSW